MDERRNMGPAAARLMALIEGLGMPYGHERSVKITKGCLNDRRFLLSLHKSSLAPDPAARLLAIGDALGLPGAYRTEIETSLEAADFVHFGFEQGARGAFCKIYLEYAERLRRALAGPGPAPDSMLVHRAFKWSPTDPAARAITLYRCYPGLTAAGIDDRLVALFDGNQDAMPLRAARILLERTLESISEEDIFYLSVSEENTSRESFDLRVYDAELLIKDIQNIVNDLMIHYDISEKIAKRFVEGEGNEIFGHMAGGRSRNGKEFVSLYFGITAR